MKILLFAISLFAISTIVRSQSVNSIKSKYDLINEYTQDGYTLVCRQNLWGVIDNTGKEIVPIKYDNILQFDKNNCAVVSIKGKYGTIDKNAVIKIPLEYDYISPLVSDEGTYTAVKNGKWGMIDLQNHILVPFTFFSGAFNSNGDGIFNGISSSLTITRFLPDGQEIKIPNLKEISVIAKGFYKVITKDNQVGIINNDQEYIIPLGSGKISSFIKSEGLIKMREEEDFGVYNLITKQWVLNPEFKSLHSLCDDNLIEAVIKRATDDEDGELNFFDKKGNMLLGKTFQDSETPDGGGERLGFMKLKYYDKWGLVHYNGTQILPFEMSSEDEIRVSEAKYVFAKRETGWGVIDTKGNEIIPFKYYSGESMNPFSNPFSFYSSDEEGYFECMTIVNGERKYGVIDKKGQAVVPFQYDEFQINIENDLDLNQTYAIILVKDNLKIQHLNSKEILFEQKVDNKSVFNVFFLTSRSENEDIGNRGQFFEGIIKKGEQAGIYVLNQKKYYSSTSFAFERYLWPNKNFLVKNKRNQYALANSDGTLLTGFDYEYFFTGLTSGANDNGLYFTVKNNRAGFINGLGETIVPFEYDVIRDAFGGITNGTSFSNGYCDGLTKNGKKVLFKANGELVDTRAFNLPESSEYVYSEFGKKSYLIGYTSSGGTFNFNDEMIQVGYNFQFLGTLLAQDESNYYPEFYFPNGVEAIKKNGKYAYFSYDGSQITPFEFDKASKMTVLGYAYVQKGNEYFLIDNKGRRLSFTDLYLEIFKEKNK